jgi:hypothetical protein
MKKTLRGLLIVSGTLLLGAFLICVAYDLAVYEPYATDIQSIIDHAKPEDRAPPAHVARLVLASEPEGLEGILTRMLIQRFDQTSKRSYLANKLLWWPLIHFRLSKQEQMTLYCSLIYVGHYGNGLSSASSGMFHKPLSSLSQAEAATVVAYPWGPQYYERHPQALVHRRDMLLQRSGAGL